MEHEMEELWSFTAAQRNIRSELLAVTECQKGEVIPLLCVMMEYGLPKDLIVHLCLALRDRPNVKTPGKRFQVGHQFEKRVYQEPDKKKEIKFTLANATGLSEYTVRNYHRHFVEELEKRGWTLEELDRFRAFIRDPTIEAPPS